MYPIYLPLLKCGVLQRKLALYSMKKKWVVALSPFEHFGFNGIKAHRFPIKEELNLPVQILSHILPSYLHVTVVSSYDNCRVVIVDYNASVTPYVRLRIRGMLWGLYWLLNVLFSPKLYILTLFVLASAIYKPNDKEVHKHGQYHKDYDSRFVRWKYLVSKDYPKHKFLAFYIICI